jgi:glycine cleavage system H protein
MSKVLPELRYTKEHEWARLEAGKVRVGITDFAQKELHEIVMVELPAVGAKVKAAQKFGTVDSVKATSDIFAPVAGEVVEVNGKLEEAPELANKDPYGQGWMIVIKPANVKELDALLTATAYQKLVKDLQAKK